VVSAESEILDCHVAGLLAVTGVGGRRFTVHGAQGLRFTVQSVELGVYCKSGDTQCVGFTGEYQGENLEGLITGGMWALPIMGKCAMV